MKTLKEFLKGKIKAGCKSATPLKKTQEVLIDSWPKQVICFEAGESTGQGETIVRYSSSSELQK